MNDQNKYRCEHSFDRETCEFCNPQLQGETHFGGLLTAWDMDDDNPLLGELPSKEELAAKRIKDKEAKELAKKQAKEKAIAEIQKDIFGDDKVDTDQELIDKLPF